MKTARFITIIEIKDERNEFLPIPSASEIEMYLYRSLNMTEGVDKITVVPLYPVKRQSTEGE